MVNTTTTTTTEKSLAQYVASLGGMKIADDENGYIRELNRTLRGRNSVIRPNGESFDRLASDAADAGYAVDEFSFVDALYQDALAWSEGETVRGRIYPATWSGETDELEGDAYGDAYAEYLRYNGIDPDDDGEPEADVELDDEPLAALVAVDETAPALELEADVEAERTAYLTGSTNELTGPYNLPMVNTTTTTTKTGAVALEVSCPECGSRHASNMPAVFHPDNSIARVIELDPTREVWCANCERVTSLERAIAQQEAKRVAARRNALECEARDARYRALDELEAAGEHIVDSEGIDGGSLGACVPWCPACDTEAEPGRCECGAPLRVFEGELFCNDCEQF